MSLWYNTVDQDEYQAPGWDSQPSSGPIGHNFNDDARTTRSFGSEYSGNEVLPSIEEPEDMNSTTIADSEEDDSPEIHARSRNGEDIDEASSTPHAMGTIEAHMDPTWQSGNSEEDWPDEPFIPHTESYCLENLFVVFVELSGFLIEDLLVTWDGDFLQISGVIYRVLSNGGSLHGAGSSVGNFFRRVIFPLAIHVRGMMVDEQRMCWYLEDGLLRVDMPIVEVDALIVEVPPTHMRIGIW
ncbi:hypothetical protein F5Y03DRAFT_261407 [Xylaria venustula]|nr:hypothetical protein F5Y03DRAFT_261407 [Xylaria venustula]